MWGRVAKNEHRFFSEKKKRNPCRGLSKTQRPLAEARSSRRAVPAPVSMAALASGTEDDPPVELHGSPGETPDVGQLSPVARVDPGEPRHLDAVAEIVALARHVSTTRPGPGKALTHAAKRLHAVLTHAHGVDGREVLDVMVASLRVRAHDFAPDLSRPFSSFLLQSIFFFPPPDPWHSRRRVWPPRRTCTWRTN